MQVDLTNCDREPIHLLGTVQPFGCLIGVDANWIVSHASQTTAAFLGVTPQEIIGQPLVSILNPDALHTVRGRMQAMHGPDAVERIFGLNAKGDGRLFDLAVHRSPQGIILELEPSTPDDSLNAVPTVRTMLARLQTRPDLKSFFADAARQMRALTGFDRVMIYRFEASGSGEVVAEAARSDLVKFLGLHFPESDIPKQARILYERNWLRIIADVNATPSPILSAPDAGSVPDLSMSMLRSVSPIHIEYLQNMKVGASLSISILRQGKLWGLFACHHMAPRHISYERRSAAELFGQMFSLLLESREREFASQYESTARRKHEELVAEMAAGAASFNQIDEHLESFRELVPSDGVSAFLSGSIKQSGMTPTSEETLGLVRFLSENADGKIYATDEIGKVYPPGKDFSQRAGGLLAIPLTQNAGDFIVFFRKEIARAVTWGGDPTKVETPGPNGLRLTPRKSFEAWQEVVKGQSQPWSEVDFRLAESLRVTLLEVVLRLTDVAAKERKAAQARQELLIAELNHRVRNILALIRGLIVQSKEREMSLEEFANVIGGRVQALARAHDQITVDNWGPAPLRALFVAETAAYLDQKAGRVQLEGPEVLLEPQAFSTVALVVHELLTNSAKYGALCDSVGKVRVNWKLEATGQLVIDWEEEGGPPVKPPTRRGFGSTIIERSIPFDLKGEAEVKYDFAGLKARFAIPSSFVKVNQQQSQTRTIKLEKKEEPKAAPAGSLKGLALVVEDNLIIALDAEDMLERMGAEQVEVAPNAAEALRILETQRPNFALLDVNLGNESSFPVADRLLELGVPFVFATGYGKNIDFPERFARIPVVTKPYMMDGLAPKLAEAFAAAKP